MTHDHSIEILLGMAPDRSAKERRMAEKHVALCSDCWDVLQVIHELTTGEAAPDSERMAALYGCADIRDDLYLLAGLHPTEIRAKHPSAAAHLSWCLACRGRLAEILAVEAAAVRDEFETGLATATLWKEIRDAAQGIIREAVGRIVVGVSEATAEFTTVPDGFLLTPVPVAAGELRGDATPETGQARELRFPLGDSGLLAELLLEPEGGGRLGLAVRISGRPQGVFSVRLSSTGPEAGGGLARYTARGADPVILKGLRPGPYLLEVLEKEHQLHFQLHVDVVLGE